MPASNESTGTSLNFESRCGVFNRITFLAFFVFFVCFVFNRF